MLNRVSAKIVSATCYICENVYGMSVNGRFKRLYGWIRYGASMFIINVINTLSLIVLIQILHIPLENIGVFAVCYAILRITSFGVHADSIALCTLITMSYYIGGTLLGTYVTIPLPVGIVLCFVVAYLFFRYAPAETKKRPLDNNQFFYRLLSFISLIFAIGFYFWFKINQYNTYANLILVAMCCQSINLLPVIYKLLEKKEETL